MSSKPRPPRSGHPTRVFLLAASTMGLAFSSSAFGVTRFVDPASPGPLHNGTSWATAHTTLTAALAVAVSGDQIWLADGTYVPTTTTDRNVAFIIPSGVKVFGGFDGFGTNETELSQREILVHRAILSGNIGAPGTNADNSYTVVRISTNAAATTRLDGVTVTGGNANGGTSLNQGAGIDVRGNPTIRNCIFVGNTALSTGGAAICTNTVCSFVNCVFSGNTATVGAAIDIQNGRASILNCTIIANTCLNSGGSAVRYFNGDGFNSLVRNSILYNNTAPTGSLQFQQISAFNSDLIVDRSCIQGLDGSLGGTGNLGGPPRFVDANGLDNIVGTIDDNLALRGGSSGIDAGDNGMVHPDLDDLDGDGIFGAEAVPFDLASQARFTDDVVNNAGAGTGAIVDMGAYEFRQPVRVICVNDNATGTGFGTSWANAHTSLQSALQDAGDIKDPAPEVIWVAQGTYKPSLPAGRAATFAMLANVRIYGGFDDSGTQGSISQRTPDDTRSILSGDIGAPGNADNCFHVVTANGANFFGSIRPTLDGFVITQGNCNGGGADTAGGGIRCFGTTTADPIIRHCKFVGNDGVIASAIDSINSDATFVNCVVSGNGQTDGGGVIRMGNISTPSLINCTIANNMPFGLSITANANVSITSCVVVDNGNSSQSNQISLSGGTLSLDYSCVENLTGSLGGLGNIGTVPFFVDPNGADDTFGTADDDYRLLECSSGIDAANFSALPLDGDDLDDDGSLVERLPNDLAFVNRSMNDLGIIDTGVGVNQPDMGAYEFQGLSGGPCPADIAPALGGNGVVNVEDLLAVIGAWGACSGCEADLAPTCGNGQVNVVDLLAVISAWGNCP